MLFSELKRITGGEFLRLDYDQPIDKFSVDSRKVIGRSSEVFIAIKGVRNDGHDFLKDLDLQNFIIEDASKAPKNGNVILVPSGLKALHLLAKNHREKFKYPVLAITGSNGKTTIKEWLFEMVSEELKVIKSPKSYNSQIGVPLSVLEMGTHDLAIFEAGISEAGEMEKLANIIQPTIGLFTNIGEAHSKGFLSQQQKIEEKSLLFKDCERIICRKEHEQIIGILDQIYPGKIITWSFDDPSADYCPSLVNDHWQFSSRRLNFKLPFQNREQVENLTHAIICALELGISANSILTAITHLKPLSMRLELKKAQNGCYLVDDSYNNDLIGLEVALDFMNEQNPHQKKVLILSDLVQSSLNKDELATRISELVRNKKIDRYFHIGTTPSNAEATFSSTPEFIENLPDFNNETILVKGARVFAFEQIVEKLQEKTHGTSLEINFEALRRNLNKFRKLLEPKTKLMVMVKAFAYGSGLSEIAGFLQHEHVDYLGVAYLDEAIALRKKGITLPIMIMNPGEVDFSYFQKYSLEAEIYSLQILKKFIAEKIEAKIHLKLETGMNRLGITEQELDSVLVFLMENKQIKVQSILTHFSSSDLSAEDAFTHKQAMKFKKMADKIETSIGYRPSRHAVNSTGIVRFPEYHFDMVRLGIGLHGFDGSGQLDLDTTAQLKSHVSQVRKIRAGESIGYSRKGRAARDMQIAVVPIGYSDGYLRVFGNGNAYVKIKGQKARTIGNICMDMSMIDVTGLTVSEGDEVVIFGDSPGISELADWADTIPYEILTNISERVKRIYISE